MPSRIRRPDNWEDLQNALVSSRRSLSPSRFSDGAFCGAEAEARDEDGVTADSARFSPYHSRRETARPFFGSKSTVPYGNITGMAPVRRSMESSIDEQLGRGINYVSKLMCVSFWGILCGFDEGKFQSGGGVSPCDRTTSRLLF
jgi:hypothetical protein